MEGFATGSIFSCYCLSGSFSLKLKNVVTQTAIGSSVLKPEEEGIPTKTRTVRRDPLARLGTTARQSWMVLGRTTSWIVEFEEREVVVERESNEKDAVFDCLKVFMRTELSNMLALFFVLHFSFH